MLSHSQNAASVSKIIAVFCVMVAGCTWFDKWPPTLVATHGCDKMTKSKFATFAYCKNNDAGHSSKFLFAVGYFLLVYCFMKFTAFLLVNQLIGWATLCGQHPAHGWNRTERACIFNLINDKISYSILCSLIFPFLLAHETLLQL